MFPWLLAPVACAPEEAVSAFVAQTDEDGDGWAVGLDCDDTTARANPGAPEYCNGEDDDCDGVVDDHAVDGDSAWADRDGDGWGDNAAPDTFCEGATATWSYTVGDCDDEDPARNPGAIESCGTEADDDCDGDTNDEGAAGCALWWEDADEDGAGGIADMCVCEPVAGWSATGWSDCDDRDPTRTEGCGVAGDHQLDELPIVAVGRTSNDAAGTMLLPLGDVTGDGRPEAGFLLPGDSRDRLFGLSAPFDRPRDLSGANVLIDPDGTWDAIGAATALDLDGDGVAELPISLCDPSGLFGVELAPTPLLGEVALDDADLWLETSVTNACQSVVSALADADADGAPELVVTNLLAGGAWLFEVGDAPPADLLDAGSTVPIPGAACNGGVATPGDVDGDGLDDLVIADPCAPTGAIHYVLSPSVDGLGALDVDRTLAGPMLSPWGMVVAPAGDLDGDGLADVLVAAPGLDGDRVAGFVWAIGDPTAGDDLDGAAFGTLLGSDTATEAVAAADLDDDGAPDVAVGMPRSDVLAEDGGAVALVFGPLAGARDLGDADARWLGIASADLAGTSLLGLDDATQDGLPGLWIGAPGSDLLASGAGAAWFLAGGAR